MNEDPFLSGLPQPPSPPSLPAKFWLMFTLGVLLLIATGFLSWEWESIVPLVGGLGIAFVSVFFRRYRGIFLGFITTIGVAFLGSIILCGVIIARKH